MKNVFIIGGTTFDHIVTLNEFPQPVPQTIHHAPFYEATGSTGAGKALCLEKLGVSNVLYSVLGDDEYGKRIINHLASENVNFVFDFDPKGTERHINIMNANGERISMFITQSSGKPDISFEKVEQEVKNADIIVLNIISYCKEIIPVLPVGHKPVWTDLHDYTDGNEYHEPFIEASDYIFLSSDNLDDYQKTMINLMERGKELVVCTHGKKGATALTKNSEWITEKALTDFDLADSNGAGDNFFSGFLYAFINGMSVRESMRYGAICGAECITSKQLVSDRLNQKLLESLYRKYYTV